MVPKPRSTKVAVTAFREKLLQDLHQGLTIEGLAAKHEVKRFVIQHHLTRIREQMNVAEKENLGRIVRRNRQLVADNEKMAGFIKKAQRILKDRGVAQAVINDIEVVAQKSNFTPMEKVVTYACLVYGKVTDKSGKIIDQELSRVAHAIKIYPESLRFAIESIARKMPKTEKTPPKTI